MIILFPSLKDEMYGALDAMKLRIMLEATTARSFTFFLPGGMTTDTHLA